MTTSPPVRPTHDILRPPVARWTPVTGDLADVLADRPSPVAATTDLVVLVSPDGATGSGPVGAEGLQVLEALGLDPQAVAAAHEPDGAAGARTTLPFAPGELAVRRLHLVGLGAGRPADWRAAGAVIGRTTRGREHVLVHVPDGWAEEDLAGLVEAVTLAGWTPPRWTARTEPAASRPVSRVSAVMSADGAAVVTRAVLRARAALVARGLGTTPSNVKNPAWLAARARTVAARAGLTITVRNEKDLAREGFGGLLAVGGGSATPPRLVQLDHVPPGASPATPHVVLVGKGITFDTGGLNVKPAEGMAAMKTDMAGAAAVLGVLSACRDLEVPVRVTGLLALAENAVSGAAYRPGDVITQFGGTTVEIGNTDAEGRIVLADALAYAATRLRPDAIVDIATLTGAARVALARVMAPIYATDDTLRDALVAAGATVGETLWPMPLPTAYRAALDSDVADLKQFTAANGGGSIMAAMLLGEFVGDTAWAHLDIAGPGRSDVDAGILAKGATGFGTRVLLRWLEGWG